MNAVISLLQRDFILAVRLGGSPAQALGFYVVAGTMIGLGLGPEPQLLARAAPGLIWVLALLSTLLALDRLFQADFEDGGLELMALSDAPLTLLVLAKIVSHWLTSGLPLILGTPILALLFGLSPDILGLLIVSMLIGTPGLSLIGAIGAALTVGIRRGGLLLSLLVLPLYVPVLIFAVAAVDAGVGGLDPTPHLLLLAATTLVALAVAPLAASAALRLHLS